MPLCFPARLFNTHFRGGLSAYGILAGWVCFPWDTGGRARVPRKEMEDTLCEILRSVVPTQNNEEQMQLTWPESGLPPAALSSALPSHNIDPPTLLIFTFAFLDVSMFQIELLGFIPGVLFPP